MYEGKKGEDEYLVEGKGASCIVVQFMTIVTLNKLYTTIEMSEHIAMKVAHSGECFRFEFKRKSLQIMSEIIQIHKNIWNRICS